MRRGAASGRGVRYGLLVQWHGGTGGEIHADEEGPLAQKTVGREGALVGEYDPHFVLSVLGDFDMFESGYGEGGGFEVEVGAQIVDIFVALFGGELKMEHLLFGDRAVAFDNQGIPFERDGADPGDRFGFWRKAGGSGMRCAGCGGAFGSTLFLITA